MHFLKHLWVVLVALIITQAHAQTDIIHGQSNAPFEHFGQNYIDANVGLALLEGEFPFPGVSFLFGRRSFRSESTFLDAELGLAFPSIATAKLGVGHYNPASGRSVAAGIRPWPAHVYFQFGREDNRCGEDVKPRVARRLKRRGKDASDILCGESILSIEASAWLLQSLLEGRDEYGRLLSYSGDTYEMSMWSTLMITWSHRWYLH